MTRLAQFALAFLGMLPATAAEAATLELPPSVERAAWDAPWRHLVSLRTLPDTATVTLHDNGNGWTLEVRVGTGAPRSAQIDTPKSEEDRIDALFLATALARPQSSALTWDDVPVRQLPPPTPKPPVEA